MPSRIDTATLRVLRTHGHHPAAERVVYAFSRTGEHGALWLALAAAGAALDRERRLVHVRAAAAIGAAYGLSQGIKFIVRRQRPDIAGLPPALHRPSTLSFPSAHAATAFAGARTLARVWPAAPLYAVAVAMAVSRPYVGVHYPSDSLAGALLGTAVAELAA